MTVARTGGLVYLGSLVPSVGGPESIASLAGRLRDGALAGLGSLFEASGVLTRVPPGHCSAGLTGGSPCPVEPPWLTGDAPLGGDVVRQAGQAVSIAQAVVDLPATDPAVQGRFLLAPPSGADNSVAGSGPVRARARRPGPGALTGACLGSRWALAGRPRIRGCEDANGPGRRVRGALDRIGGVVGSVARVGGVIVVRAATSAPWRGRTGVFVAPGATPRCGPPGQRPVARPPGQHPLRGPGAVGPVRPGRGRLAGLARGPIRA